jgi:tripartite-type tricarboxylate transporter receptor subunit TctC
MAVNAVPTQIYRPFVAPPGTAKDAIKILRDAFANALKDKDLLAEAAKGKMTIDYMSPEDALKVVSEVLGQPPDIVQTLAKHIKFGD